MMKGIAAVLKQLEREREQLDSQITQLDRALNTLSGLDGRRGLTEEVRGGCQPQPEHGLQRHNADDGRSGKPSSERKLLRRFPKKREPWGTPASGNGFTSQRSTSHSAE